MNFEGETGWGSLVENTFGSLQMNSTTIEVNASTAVENRATHVFTGRPVYK
jgi:hypothetical protein